jgi:hypothetical protein
LVVLAHELDKPFFALNSLAYRADLILSVEELESGYSKEITGELSVIYKHIRDPVLHAPHSYHYKLNENNVRILAIGQTV